MLTEQCVACGAEVPLSDAVHMLVNPKDDVGVTDGYICRACYVERVEPILAGVGDEDAMDEGDDGAGSEGSGGGEGDEEEPDVVGDRRPDQAPAGDVPEEPEGGDRPAEGV